MQSGDLFQKVITNPYYTIGFTLLLWLFIFNLLTHILKISELNWKRLEYFWIIIGFFGILTVVNGNHKDYLEGEMRFTKNWIAQETNRLSRILTGSQSCFTFIKALSSPTNLDDIQFDQDLICQWSKDYSINVFDQSGIPANVLDTLSIFNLKFKTNDQNEYVNEFVKLTKSINKNVIQYKEYSKSASSHKLESFNRSLGIILLLFAFSVRLSIVTHNIKSIKQQNSNIENKIKQDNQ